MGLAIMILKLVESYTTTSDAEAGWTFTDKTCNTTYSTCTSRGIQLVCYSFDRGATAVGPVSDEFGMNDGAGTSDVVHLH